MDGPKIEVDSGGFNTHSTLLLAIASATVIVSVAVAVAVYRISTGIMWAAIIAAAGAATQQVLVGIGIMRRHTLLGRAELTRAQGQATAARISAAANAHKHYLEATCPPPTTPASCS